VQSHSTTARIRPASNHMAHRLAPPPPNMP
jgi:hypothetical protein